jgi:hypothetical protein
MSNMGVSQPVSRYETHESYVQRLSPLPEPTYVVMAARFLDAALRIWDEDQAQAKSQIKLASAMLRIDTDDPAMAEKPSGRVGTGLVPWQEHKVREFIDGSLNSKIRLQDCAGKVRLSTGHVWHDGPRLHSPASSRAGATIDADLGTAVGPDRAVLRFC